MSETINKSVSDTISIIIPIYNSTEYLGECLESVLFQTVIPYEIIIVDDGSEEEKAGIIDDYGKRSELIKVFHTKNRGQHAARDYGISKSKGEWLLFLDSDDVLAEDAIETLLKYIKFPEYNKIDCYIYRFKTFSGQFDQEKEIEESITIIDNKRELYKTVFTDETYNPMWIKAVKKSLFTSDYSEFYDVRMGEDLIQSIDVYRNAKTVAFIDKTLYYYRTNNNGITNSIRKRKYSFESRPCELVHKFLIEEAVFNDEDWVEYDQKALLMFIQEIERVIISKMSFSEIRSQLIEAHNSKHYINYISNVKCILFKGKKITIYLFRKQLYLGLFLLGVIRRDLLRRYG